MFEPRYLNKRNYRNLTLQLRKLVDWVRWSIKAKEIGLSAIGLLWTTCWGLNMEKVKNLVHC